jgi:hypothetical protein
MFIHENSKAFFARSETTHSREGISTTRSFSDMPAASVTTLDYINQHKASAIKIVKFLQKST